MTAPCFWDINSGRSLRTLEGHAAAVSSVAVSPDGITLASGAQDDTVRIWDITSGHSISVFVGHAAAVSSVAFSSDGLTLVSANDTIVHIWNVASGRSDRAFEGHKSSPTRFRRSNARTLALHI